MQVYKADADEKLHRTRLTEEHVYLNPHSSMRVNLAVQVSMNRGDHENIKLLTFCEVIFVIQVYHVSLALYCIISC